MKKKKHKEEKTQHCKENKTPEQARKLFKNAKTFEDLKNLMLCVLVGTMPSPVYHFEPLEEENSDNDWWGGASWKHLLKMNIQGFVTTESEDGENEVVNEGEVMVRASVTGLLHHSKVGNVLKKLNLKGFVAWAEPPYTMYKKSRPNFNMAVPRAFVDGSTGAIFPFGAGAMAAMGAFESGPGVPEEYTYRFLNENLIKTLKKDYVVLQAFDPSFERSGKDKLFNAVAVAVERSNTTSLAKGKQAEKEFQDDKGLNTLTIPIAPCLAAGSFEDLQERTAQALSKEMQNPVLVVAPGKQEVSAGSTALQCIIDMTRLGFVTTESEHASQSTSASQSSRASLAGLLLKSKLAGVKKTLNRVGLVAWAELLETQEDRYRDERTQQIIKTKIDAGEPELEAVTNAVEQMHVHRERDRRKIAEAWKKSNIEGVWHNTVMGTYNIHIPGTISNEGVEASIPFGAGPKAAVHRLKDLVSSELHRTLKDNYVVMTVFDPVFGRPAEKVLFPAVIETLKVLQTHF